MKQHYLIFFFVTLFALVILSGCWNDTEENESHPADGIWLLTLEGGDYYTDSPLYQLISLKIIDQKAKAALFFIMCMVPV